VLLCPSTFEEDLDPSSFKNIEGFVKETALQKVLEVDRRLSSGPDRADVIIGADTMVTLDGKLFGKPNDSKDAFRMLSELNGREHIVYTGVVVKNGPKIVKFCEKTSVFFGNLTSEQISAYVATGEPLDKAGAYGIQGIGGTMIERIEGDYFTVMGLPLYRLSSVLFDMFYEKSKD